MLTDAEAQALLAMPKHFLDHSTIAILPGGGDSRDLVSATKPAEAFVLDYHRSSIRIAKATYQTRAKGSIVLARLDLDGPPHTNPDGQKIDCPHLHVYRQGYDARWAATIDPSSFSNPADLITSLVEFCAFCNILNLPSIQTTT